MPAPTLLWDEEAAYGALKAWLDAAYGTGGVAGLLTGRAIPDLDVARIYRRRQQPPSFDEPAITILATTPRPVPRSARLDRLDVAQRQRWLVTVDAAVDGQAYQVEALGEQTTPYVASVPPDDAAAVRAAVRAEVDALALPVTTADEGASGFTVLADDAGEHLALSVLQGPVTATVLDDAGRRTAAVEAFWTVRFRFLDVRPSGSAEPSYARRRAELLSQLLEAGHQVPVNGAGAFSYLNDPLDTSGLAYNDTQGIVLSDFVHNRAIWVDVASVDVVFAVKTGIAHDLINIQALGVQSVES